MENNNFRKYIEEFFFGINGIISISIVSSEDGKVIDYGSVDDYIDNQLASTVQVEVLRQINRSLNYVDELDDKKIKNITISLDEQEHFVFNSSDGSFIIHIVADSQKVNVGLVKMLHEKYVHLVE